VLEGANEHMERELRHASGSVTFPGLLQHAISEEGSFTTVVICTLAFLTAVSLTIYFTAKLFAVVP
jgi:hypothetical protein